MRFVPDSADRVDLDSNNDIRDDDDDDDRRR